MFAKASWAAAVAAAAIELTFNEAPPVELGNGVGRLLLDECGFIELCRRCELFDCSRS